MALIELGTLKDYWKKVNDWIDGGAFSPKVNIDQTTPGTTNGVVVNSSILPTGASTEAKQDTLIAKDFATQTTLTAIMDTNGIKKITDAVTVVGNAADNVAVSGNPVLSAGLYSAIPVTRDDGDVVTLQTTANGALLTQTTIAGSLAKLSTEPDPPGEDGNTLIVFYPDPLDNKYYRYYSGAWREI